MLLIGIDDTDNIETRGTGSLARQIASQISSFSQILGVTRHQLLVDPRIPYTKNNSSAAILVETEVEPEKLFDMVLSIVSNSIQPGSDPGICLASQVAHGIEVYGLRAKREIVTQEEARSLAAANGIHLKGIAGDEGGVIGALAAVGLAASGDDGRYIQLGKIRELTGLLPVGVILDAGVDAVLTADGETLEDGMVWVEKLRPSRRGGKPVAIARHLNGRWTVLKLD